MKWRQFLHLISIKKICLRKWRSIHFPKIFNIGHKNFAMGYNETPFITIMVNLNFQWKLALCRIIRHKQYDWIFTIGDRQLHIRHNCPSLIWRCRKFVTRNLQDYIADLIGIEMTTADKKKCFRCLIHNKDPSSNGIGQLGALSPFFWSLWQIHIFNRFTGLV